MADNGFLNSRFLHRCRPIGYRHPKEIIIYYREPDTLVENTGGEMLEFWKLSSSEQDSATHRALTDAGYHHRVGISMDGHADRAAMQTVLDNGHKFDHWTHLYEDRQWESAFYFKSERDAVQFRLTIP